jgi:hypothetical protein
MGPLSPQPQTLLLLLTSHFSLTVLTFIFVLNTNASPTQSRNSHGILGLTAV